MLIAVAPPGESIASIDAGGKEWCRLRLCSDDATRGFIAGSGMEQVRSGALPPDRATRAFAESGDVLEYRVVRDEGCGPASAEAAFPPTALIRITVVGREKDLVGTRPLLEPHGR